MNVRITANITSHETATYEVEWDGDIDDCATEARELVESGEYDPVTTKIHDVDVDVVEVVEV